MAVRGERGGLVPLRGDRPIEDAPRDSGVLLAFGLLWRLLDQPGQAVSKQTLLRDVWHLRFQPETNSLAVHVSRLRKKLGHAVIDTVRGIGYRLGSAR